MSGFVRYVDAAGEKQSVRHVEDIADDGDCWSYEKPINSPPPAYGAQKKGECTQFVFSGNVDVVPHPIVNGRNREPRFNWTPVYSARLSAIANTLAMVMLFGLAFAFSRGVAQQKTRLEEMILEHPGIVGFYANKINCLAMLLMIVSGADAVFAILGCSRFLWRHIVVTNAVFALVRLLLLVVGACIMLTAPTQTFVKSMYGRKGA